MTAEDASIIGSLVEVLIKLDFADDEEYDYWFNLYIDLMDD